MVLDLQGQWFIGKLGGGFKYFLFSPRSLGETIQFDGPHIFQMGGKKPPPRKSPKPVADFFIKNFGDIPFLDVTMTIAEELL